jgi:hypothetical protein
VLALGDFEARFLVELVDAIDAEVGGRELAFGG